MKIYGLLLLCAIVAGCETSETADRSGERARRAVPSPTERNSASGEREQMAGIDGVPIVTVDFPNREDQQPRVRTIVDNIVRPVETGEVTGVPATTGGVGVTIGATETQPAPPATRPSPTTRPGDLLLGPRE